MGRILKPKMLGRLLSSNKRVSRQTVRVLSSPPPPAPITPADIEESNVRAAKYAKYLQKSSGATGFTGVMPSGRDIFAPKNVADVAALTGMPAEHANRTVVIAPRQKKNLQSGEKYSHQWQLTWKHAERWSNPLMGWTSSADPMSNVKLTFDSREDAIAFAAKSNWKYEVREPTSTTTVEAGSQAYADNFLPKKVMMQAKEEGLKNKIFYNPEQNKSNWFMPLTYHGDAEVQQHGPPVAHA